MNINLAIECIQSAVDNFQYLWTKFTGVRGHGITMDLSLTSIKISSN